MTDQVLEILTDLQSRLTALQADMATKADVAALRADVSTLKSDMAVLKSDVTGVKSDLAVLRADTAGDGAALRAGLTALAADIAPMRAQLDGLPLINRAVTVIQRDLRSLRDDMTVLTAIVIRLDGSHTNLLQELHATRAQIVRMNQRVTALEYPELEHPEPSSPP